MCLNVYCPFDRFNIDGKVNIRGCFHSRKHLQEVSRMWYMRTQRRLCVFVTARAEAVSCACGERRGGVKDGNGRSLRIDGSFNCDRGFSRDRNKLRRELQCCVEDSLYDPLKGDHSRSCLLGLDHARNFFLERATSCLLAFLAPFLFLVWTRWLFALRGLVFIRATKQVTPRNVD
jgi:hypothetical protein